ncbi:MAG: M14 family metallopeptidase [Bacteroidia bacterium]
MRHLSVILISLTFFSWTSSTLENQFLTTFEKSNGTKSASYTDGISWWDNLAKNFDEVHMQEFGMTDAGYPLHTIVLSKGKVKLENVKSSSKSTILINNAIHPGEPDGVDASMMLYRDILLDHRELMDSCIVVCIPYYNIGGALNRSNSSRANQNGPMEYGFRGNAQNLDLNRDFVKCDSRNAQSFAKLLQLIDPDVYVETHVSNGADYQYNITYLSTQPDKLGGQMGSHLRSKMIPSLEQKMKSKGNEMVPYVNHWGGPLKDSYATFYDSPRYSSGLTTLHNIFGFITETHMLKPFKQRVEATYDYLLSTVEYTKEQNSQIQVARDIQKSDVASATTMPIDWDVDKYDFKEIQFKGYEYGYKKSEVSGEDRLYYDRSKPITKSMFYRGSMLETTRKTKPKAYILRRGFIDVEDRLRWNGVELKELSQDTTIKVEVYKIVEFETVDQAYEKHYLHYDTKIDMDTIDWTFRKGDYLISTGTDKDRFILEMLEPEGPDSYFNWNFFDAVLQQKEHYSAYVFEDRAADLLANNPALKAQFEKAKQSKASSRGGMTAPEQLEWIYKHSPHSEKELKKLPVFKVL